MSLSGQSLRLHTAPVRFGRLRSRVLTSSRPLRSVSASPSQAGPLHCSAPLIISCSNVCATLSSRERCIVFVSASLFTKARSTDLRFVCIYSRTRALRSIREGISTQRGRNRRHVTAPRFPLTSIHIDAFAFDSKTTSSHKSE